MANELSLFEQEKPVICLPVKGGELFHVDAEYYRKAQSTYKNINVGEQLQEMDMWLVSNPSKQKTMRGMPKFINGWLSRSNKAPKQDNKQSFQSLHDTVKF